MGLGAGQVDAEAGAVRALVEAVAHALRAELDLLEQDVVPMVSGHAWSSGFWCASLRLLRVGRGRMGPPQVEPDHLAQDARGVPSQRGRRSRWDGAPIEE